VASPPGFPAAGFLFGAGAGLTGGGLLFLLLTGQLDHALAGAALLFGEPAAGVGGAGGALRLRSADIEAGPLLGR